jgi:hypothetical protein
VIVLVKEIAGNLERVNVVKIVYVKMVERVIKMVVVIVVIFGPVRNAKKKFM